MSINVTMNRPGSVQINNGGVAGLAASGDTTDFTAMTPDALIAYCQARLGGLNNQMVKIFNAQTVAQNKQKLISKFNEQIPQGEFDDQGSKDVFVQNATQFRDSFPVGSREYQQAQGIIDKINGGGDNKVTDQELADIRQSCKDMGSDISTEQQTDMIQLQSYMSQYQTAVQLCTGLVQKLGQVSESIAQKIGS